MRTEFGKYVAKLRIDKDISLRDLAKIIGVSAAYLSAVETGKKTVTNILFSNLIRALNLEEYQVNQLQLAANKSLGIVKINLNKYSFKDRDIILGLIHKYDNQPQSGE